MTKARAVASVFVGGTAGGALRLAIDHAVALDGRLPWDIIAINVIGSLLLGAVVARTLTRGQQWWTPLITAGALGGFTTFSAMATLEWTAGQSFAVTAIALAATMALAVIAAALGFRWGARDRFDEPGELA